MTGEYARAQIAAYVARQGRWRASLASKHPEDAKRNQRAAVGLQELSRYIEELSLEDRRLVTLSRWMEGPWFKPPEQLERALSRFRMGDPQEDCGAFLSWVIERQRRRVPESLTANVDRQTRQLTATIDNYRDEI